MRLLFVVDGRSPIALNWMRHFIHAGWEVHLASTFPCAPEPGLASFHTVPVAFSGLKRSLAAAKNPESQAADGSALSSKGAAPPILQRPGVRVRTWARQMLGPLTLPGAAQALRAVAAQIKPDLVHAMRIPYEGMLAAQAGLGLPLLVSIWGNDFTLHAPSNPWMAAATRRALQGASAIHADCRRDVRLARLWGFPEDHPAVVLPGAGGVQMDIFRLPMEGERSPTPLVIQPRGVRAYVRNDTFFKAIPPVLQARPEVRFVCPAMAGDPQAERWQAECGASQAVQLLPRLPRPQVADLFRQAWAAVSPSTHDGTPNTLLEAMACGCFPLAGDIESLREWILPGVNGLLFDPGDTPALAQAILLALESEPLRQRAQAINREEISRRAEYTTSMSQAETFYRELIERQ
jgi:glycosyltransferase involved in cell wall biosynthesis